MSKIAEEKALEAYPLPKEESHSTSFINQETFNSAKRTGYIVGYDQAMQDFMEKACEWIEIKIICYSKREYEELIEQFKNYIKEEL
jgi:hypothetical protein